MYIKQYEDVASYDEFKPDIYWKLEILDGNWMVGCGNWIGRPSPAVSLHFFRGISVLRTNVFRVYKRGKNKDCFVKKQYFF